MDGTTGFTLNGGGRVYFATKPAEDFSDPDMYWQVTLASFFYFYKPNFSIIRIGLSGRMRKIAVFVNLGMLEMINLFQTFTDYSFIS